MEPQRHDATNDFQMPKHMNILFDTLAVDENYAAIGNTEPSIMLGMLGNVTFVAWEGFRELVVDGLNVLHRLSSKQVEEVNISLNKARRFIAQARKDHKLCEELQKKRRADNELVLAAKALKRSSVVEKKSSGNFEGGTATISGLSSHVDTTPQLDDTQANSCASSEDCVDDDWRVEMPINTSSSILDLHKDISDALIELLRLMYPEDVLRLDLRTISSENMFRENRKKMLYKYMKKVVHDYTKSSGSAEAPNATNSGAATGSALLTNNATGDESGRAQAEVDTGNRALRRSVRIAEKNDAQDARVPAGSSVVRGNRLEVPVRPVIRLSQTPDRALFRVSRNDRGSVPVCCYEFKAPALDLSGLQKQKTAPPEKEQASRSNPSPSGNDADRVHQDQQEDKMYMTGLSARTIAAEYTRVFKNPQHMDRRRSEFAGERLILLPIAQVICQALLSKTGCAFLTNHQMSFALRVEEDKHNFGLKVYVTGAIPANQIPGQFAAMLGFSKYCMDKAKASNETGLLDPQRRLLTNLSYKAYNADIDEEPLDPNWCPPGRTQTSLTTRHVVTTASGRNCAKKESREASNNASLRNNSQVTMSDGQMSSTVSQVKTVRKKFRSAMDERLKEMFSTTENVLGVGATGVITKGVWCGRKAAIKMWNGHTIEGFLSIRREIKVYQRLQEKCPFLLGFAVPKLLLGWDKPQELSVYRKELILVLEHAGEGIVKDRRGNFWTDDGRDYKRLQNIDITTICHAALLSLSKLHEEGFLHGDVALRNIRVMKTSSAKLGWHVWWVDLGGTLEIGTNVNPLHFEMEKRSCLFIFDDYAKDVKDIVYEELNHHQDVTRRGSISVI